MSKIESKRISLFRREDSEDTIVAMKIKPEEFSNKGLTNIAALRIFKPGERQCVLVMATGRVILSSEYISRVTNLDYDARTKHIADTAIAMRKAIAVHIQEKSPRRLASLSW